MKISPMCRMTKVAACGAVALAAAVVGPASLASAHASTTHASLVRGVVIARNSARHTLALSNATHGVSTLRLRSSSAVDAVALGSNVTAKALPLGDGTFNVTKFSSRGGVRRATLRATVVAATSGRLTLSSGGSVFSVTSSSRSAHDGQSSSPSAGEVVEVSVAIGAGGLDETALQQVGTTNLIELQGTLTSVTSTTLVVAAEGGATTTIAIPASLTLPSTIVAGNQVEVLVAYSNATFTLVTISDDGAASASGPAGVSSSEDGQQSSLQIEGLVVSANATSVTIQPGDQASPVVLAVPATLDVSTLTVGARVHAQGGLVGGILTLTSFQIQTSEGEQGSGMSTQVEGIVVSTSATSLVVQPGDNATPVTLVVPSTIDVSSITVGARVHAQGVLANGVLTLSDFHLQGGEDGSVNQATQIDGTVSAVSPTSLTVQPGDQSAPITVMVPATLNVSSIQMGDEVRATATLVGGVLTLTNFAVRSTSSSTVELSGVVTAVSATSLSLQAGDNSQLVTLVVPSSVNVSTLAVSDHVDVVASQTATTFTVVSVTLSS